MNSMAQGRGKTDQNIYWVAGKGKAVLLQA